MKVQDEPCKDKMAQSFGSSINGKQGNTIKTKYIQHQDALFHEISRISIFMNKLCRDRAKHLRNISCKKSGPKIYITLMQAKISITGSISSQRPSITLFQ